MLVRKMPPMVTRIESIKQIKEIYTAKNECEKRKARANDNMTFSKIILKTHST
jgi:hypothetical protein